MAKRRFTHWAKKHKDTIREISQSEAKDLIASHVSEAEIRQRMDRADIDHPIKCGIWTVWGWRYRK